MRLTQGRFTVLAHARDDVLAASLLASAIANDTFPGLPRPAAPVTIAIAPDGQRFRAWIGSTAPEWGVAVAFPYRSRVVLQGQGARSDGGDPRVVLRHELAHLALHEALGGLAPRWFDEGYASFAAGEWGREELLATNFALVLRGMPPLARVDSALIGGRGEATAAYALAHRAVAELAALDPERGLSLFFGYWRDSGSLDSAIRAAYGLTFQGFEEHWQQRTRRRYGALALFADLALFGLLVLVLVVPLYMSRRRRDLRRLATLRRDEETAERLERERAIEELLRSLQRSPPRSRERGGGGEG